LVALDRETKDEGLARGRGPGWAYKSGYVIGNAIAWPEGAFYAPLRHPDTNNIDVDAWVRWERDHIVAGVHFVGHNFGYDLSWGNVDLGIPLPPGDQIECTNARSVLIDEGALSHSLDAQCKAAGIPGKDEAVLREAIAAYGWGDIKNNLWRMPGRFVGPYAEQDARATLQLFQHQEEQVRAQELEGAYRLEMDLVPMVHEMRLCGIRVDLGAVASTQAMLYAKRDAALATLGEHTGQRIGMDEIRSNGWLEEHFAAQNIPFTRTDKAKQGSFRVAWMRRHPHWLPSLIAAARDAERMAKVFLGDFISTYAHRGRLHASIHQYLSDDDEDRDGTRTSRFSYSDPPLQQMPKRDEGLAALIRGVFLPEEGEIWGSFDYSQQEYRQIVHFALLKNCRGAAEAVERYASDPDTDFHTYVQELTDLERTPAKNTNFAKSYGAGIPRLMEMTGMDRPTAEAIVAKYDEELPFVKEIDEIAKGLAQQRGWIKLLDGARIHFNKWESARWGENRDAHGKYIAPRPWDQARQMWPNSPLRRADTRKALNALVQGSSARQIKMAGRDIYRAGHVPLIQMHDEYNFSLPPGDEAGAKRISELMRDAIKLKVPMKIDAEYGISWGHAAKVKDKEGNVLYGATWAEAREALRQRDGGL
jgi:DNA polymerase-1